MDPVAALTRLGGVARLRDLLALTTRSRVRSAESAGRIRRLATGRYALPTARPALRLAAVGTSSGRARRRPGSEPEADSWGFHASRWDHERDCVRYNALTATGWRVLRFTYDQVMFSPTYVETTVRNLLTELAA